MAVVDSLLALISSQRADGLRITSDRAPRLIFGSDERALSMPPISKATVEGFVRETVGARAADATTAERIECHYETTNGDDFEVRIERDDETLHLVLRPARAIAGAPVASEPAAIAAPIAAPITPSAAQAERPTHPAADAPVYREASVDRRMIDLLAHLEREQGSDLILSSGARARLRSRGALRELPGPVFSSEDILSLVAPAWSDNARKRLTTHGSVDLALNLTWSGETTRFRVNVFEQQRGLAAALRPIQRVMPTLSQLNLPDHLYELAEYRHGLVLVTGPTGCGKSTTLAALMEHLNRTADRHIITLEDPIEYQYEPKRCLVHQREIGQHVESFASGLRAGLREDPDVILVGEMRDRETIAAALTAAETGHLVVSTLHSGSPWTAIDRMIDVFSSEQQRQVRLQLADVLCAVLSQQLLPSTTPPARVPAYEKLLVTPAVGSLIRDEKLHQLKNSIQTGRDLGMVSLERSLVDLLRNGKIDTATAQAAARDHQVLADLSAPLQIR
jgi:twitching motility protein PilT